MGRESFSAVIFGNEREFAYSDSAVGYSLLTLRLVMAWVFLQAGIDKLLDPEWTAENFLLNAVPDANPLIGFWTLLAGTPAVDLLVVYGQIGIGLALLFGLFFRLGAFFGGVQMMLFWAAQLEGGVMAGLPVEHGYVVDSLIVYTLILIGLSSFDAGRIYGLDKKIEQHPVVEKYPRLKYLLG